MQTTIGKYQVLEVLGQGGMGVVYRARDNAIGRQVALKVMRPEVMNSADLRERFLREARAAGQLQHPNIVVVYDLGEDAGSPYIAMEFLNGEPLDKALDAGALSSAAKLAIFAQICDGLQYAHEAGVVHRDIKPANVLLARNHTPKLLDFGIARVAGSQITRSTAIIGTVSYMSPEQIRGKGVDARSDIFSAGVMLYEMLGGRRPFDQDSDFETMQAIVGQEPPELEVEGVISPDTLATIVRRAIEKDPANRYQTAGEFADAVRGYLKAQERSGTAPTVVRSRQEMTAAAVSPAPTPTPVPATPMTVPAAVQGSRQGAMPEISSGGAQAPRTPDSKKKPRWLLVGTLVVAAVVSVLLFVPVRLLAPFWPTPHQTHVQGSVQLRMVATPEDPDQGQMLSWKGESYPVQTAPIVDSSDIASATVGTDTEGRVRVLMTFTAVGSEKLRRVTAAHVGKRMAIVVGGEVVQVANIQTELSDSLEITGIKSNAEAEDLVKRIHGETR